jgi:DNA processing protein
LPDTLSPVERRVAELLGPEPVHLDHLIERAGRPVGELLAVLCALELQGLAEQRPGRLFCRV